MTFLVAIIGAGPAGLIAAEHLSARGHAVTIYDRMATPARKFLLAGRGGLNLTHSEPPAAFHQRYAADTGHLATALEAFPPQALIEWCESLGQQTFIGSSGRVFPKAMKAAPLLRAWLLRLHHQNVRLEPRHSWQGWSPRGDLQFATPAGEVLTRADATLLALGGASWPAMGSDGKWVPILRHRHVHVAPLRASNCGVLVDWSIIFADRFAGAPVKRIAIHVAGQILRGEAIITRQGLEGGPIYAASPHIRAALDADGAAILHLDLRPDITQARLAARTDIARGARSLPNFLRQSANLSPVAIGLIQEALHLGQSGPLSSLIKSLPVRVTALQPIARAISSAGGIDFEELEENFMLKQIQGVFAAGEMLNWEAPTGGYLLQACFSTAIQAAKGIDQYLTNQKPRLR